MLFMFFCIIHVNITFIIIKCFSCLCFLFLLVKFLILPPERYESVRTATFSEGSSKPNLQFTVYILV